jgi:type II secretory pathway pseudopilin PulG
MLTELLAATMLVLPVMLLSGIVANLTLRELPREQRLAQENLRVQDLLRTLRDDVESAAKLRLENAAGGGAGKLVLEAQGRTLAYTQEGGMFRRTAISGAAGDPARTWTLPDAIIRWQLAPGGDAVEVVTSLTAYEEGRPRTKLANAHVFFLGAGPGWAGGGR